MKKRMIAALLAIALALPASLAACSGDGKDSQNDTAGASDSASPAGDYKDPVVPDGPFDGVVLTALTEGTYDISDNLFGIFLEDINFSVDGGLYAELVCNRSFEYSTLVSERGKYAWVDTGNVSWSIRSGATDGTALNENNTHYARITNSGDSLAGIYNTGFFEDMAIEKGKEYKFSVYARAVDGYDGGLHVSLESSGSKVYAEGDIESLTDEWHKYTLTLTATETVSRRLHLAVRIGSGTVDLDMVSLFPADTYKGRENGIRRDLGEKLEELTPKFFRFPGGCIIEGATLAKAYSWKDSIGNALEFEINGEMTVGDVATRPICENLWSWGWQPYYMTYGLGFYEYFLLCEDLGCAPVPVVNCGMSCLAQSTNGIVQYAGIGSEEFQQYIQDALDLVEFCLGDAETTYWGGVRAAMGHPEKFDLTYIGIGNEQWGSEYNARYAKFREAFNEAKEKDPELYGSIKLIMANGPAATSRDGWDVVASEGNDIADLLDEHYYNNPTWFLMSSSRYDSYDREGPTVFIGEYAAHDENSRNSSLAAMVEAAYMTSIERNGDIVELAAYAPLFAYNGHTQWAPDLIWFDGASVWSSVNYYVQKIYANNLSDSVIPSALDVSGLAGAEPLSGMIGLGTWRTAAVFDDLVVTDNATGEVLYSNDFSEPLDSDHVTTGGNFSVNRRREALVQSNEGWPANGNAGDVIYFGDASWTNYTMTVKATKTSGAEGFIIPFAVSNGDNFWHWNIGGWNNTYSAVEYVTDGEKFGEVSATGCSFTVETNREYEIKIVVNEYSFQGYIDGELMFDYSADFMHGIYSVVGEDENDIIVKLVNTTASDVPFRVDLRGLVKYRGDAEVQYINFGEGTTENSKDAEVVTVKTDTIKVESVFEYELDALSMAVIRVPKS